MSSSIGRRLLPALAFPMVIGAVGCARVDRPVQYSMYYSHGLEADSGEGTHVYFLLDYKVWRARKPVWFIMPIERSPEVFFRKVYLCRFEPGTGRLEELAEVREEFAHGTSVKSTKWTTDGQELVFAYQTGNDLEDGILYDYRAWEPAARRLTPLGVEGNRAASTPLNDRYFADYASPWTDNPGIVGMTRLKEMLADLSVEERLGAQDQFFGHLTSLCERAFKGEATLVSGAGFDDDLIMHVRRCEADEIQIPLHVGEDRSRTWILTRTGYGLRLKHDHRLPDGTDDPVTRYGGDTVELGTATRQSFPADEFTSKNLPEAATNIWTITVVPGERLVYHLTRHGEPRATLEFDLNDQVPPPPAPWGYDGT